MQRYLLLIVMLLSHFFLAGCSSNSKIKFNHDLTRENWMQEVETDPMQWARGTDAWFLSGDAHALPTYSRTTMGTMKVSAPDFSKIRINGDFKVEIFGTEGDNSVYVYGPNQAITGTIISVRGDTLYLNQREKAVPDTRAVIIRVGVHKLNSLVQLGRGRVEGIRIGSDHLRVISAGSGNVYLAGHMNLTLLQNVGSGCVSIFGASSPELDIRTAGNGTSNVSGNVGIRSIVHHGATNINVIGANSNHLSITANGSGKVSISGIVNLCGVKASGNTRVYVCRVNSPNLHVTASEHARIGIAGFANSLYIDALDDTCVGARNVCADEAYVHASGRAHVNVAAAKKSFAAAQGSSSIYFFGPPDILTKFVKDQGFVMRICTQDSNCPVLQKVNLLLPKAELVGAG